MEDIEKMLISENNAVQSIIEKEMAAIAKANARLAIVSKLAAALPSGSPAPSSINDFGYCAQASITFEKCPLSIDEMLELYPPLECVDVTDGAKTQKPKKYIRDNELKGADIVEIFPLNYRSRKGEFSSARWWTVLADLDVEISVGSLDPNEILKICNGPKFVAQSHHYSTGNTTYFLKALATPLVKQAALVEWSLPLQEFIAKHNLGKKQANFINTIRDVAIKGAFDFFQASPAQSYYAQIKGDEGDIFSLLGDKILVDELESVIAKMMPSLKQAMDITEAQFELVHACCKEFFESHGRLRDDWIVAERIIYFLRKETGLDVKVRRMYPNYPGNVAISVFFQGVEKYPDWHFKSNLDLPVIRPQDIDVTYA